MCNVIKFVKKRGRGTEKHGSTNDFRGQRDNLFLFLKNFSHIFHHVHIKMNYNN